MKISKTKRHLPLIFQVLELKISKTKSQYCPGPALRRVLKISKTKSDICHRVTFYLAFKLKISKTKSAASNEPDGWSDC